MLDSLGCSADHKDSPEAVADPSVDTMDCSADHKDSPEAVAGPSVDTMDCSADHKDSPEAVAGPSADMTGCSADHRESPEAVADHYRQSAAQKNTRVEAPVHRPAGPAGSQEVERAADQVGVPSLLDRMT